MSLVFGVHPLLFLYSFFFVETLNMRHTKKTEEKRGVVLFWIPLCFLAAELYSTQRRDFCKRLSERRQPTPRERERERERYKEDAI